MRRNVSWSCAFVLALYIGIMPQAFGQCLVVTPTGSGNHSGADWNNAINGANLASVVTRSSVYYLSGGTYGGQMFTTADNGTQTITIRAATVVDHGVSLGCSSTGWNAAMAASPSNQVVFRCTTCKAATFGYVVTFDTDYWTLDGNGRGGYESGYNMKIDNSWNGSNGGDLGAAVGVGSGVSPISHLTVQYAEITGEGLDLEDVDVAPIASISCSNNTATVALSLQRAHAYLYPGQWVIIGGTAGKDTDFSDSTDFGQQSFNIVSPGCVEVGSTGTCTLQSPPVVHVGSNITIAGNSVSGFNGTFPITGINFALKTISFTAASSGLAIGTGGTASYNDSKGTQIQSVTSGTDWTQAFTVGGNGYTCSGATENTGVLAGPSVYATDGFHFAVNGGIGADHFTSQYNYIHDISDTCHDMRETTNTVIEYNACERGSSNALNFHEQGDTDSGSNGLTYAYNLVLDHEGTASGLVVLFSSQTGLSTNFNIFGNVFGTSDGNPYGRTSSGFGAVGCINTGSSCTNWNIFNNTIVGTTGSTHQGFLLDIADGAVAMNVACENNLVFDATQTNGTWLNSLCTSTNHNTYLNLGVDAPTLGSLEFALDSVPNPFVDTSTHNFQLSSDTVVPDLNNGVNTSSALPANSVDPNGVSRGIDGSWDRGAFQFGGSVPHPAPATNLRVTSVN